MDAFFIFGAEYLYVVSLIIALVFFLKQPRDVQKRMFILGLIALPLAYLISLGAGALYENPQPWVVEGFTPLIEQQNDNGFPSHHTLLAAAVAAVVFVFSRRVGTVLWLITILVGISRMYVGVHHLIDIVASILIAFLAVSLVKLIRVSF